MKTINNNFSESLGTEIKSIEDFRTTLIEFFSKTKGLIVEWRKLRNVPIDPVRGEWYFLAVLFTRGEDYRWSGLYVKGYLTGRSDGLGGFTFYGVKDGVYNRVVLPWNYINGDNGNNTDFKNGFETTFGVEYERWSVTQDDYFDVYTSKLYS
jgi:hypothetical protein